MEDRTMAPRKIRQLPARKKNYRGEVLIDARPAVQHIRALQARGIGITSIAEASDVCEVKIWRVLTGKQSRLAEDVATKILSVDEGARGDCFMVDSAPTIELLHKLLAAGFTRNELDEKRDLRLYRICKVKKIRAGIQQRAERLWRLVSTGQVKPDSVVAAAVAADLLNEEPRPDGWEVGTHPLSSIGPEEWIRGGWSVRGHESSKNRAKREDAELRLLARSGKGKRLGPPDS